MNLAKFLFVSALGILPAFGATTPQGDCRFRGNVEQLLASKDSYHNQKVCVTGRLHLEFEGTQLFGRKSKVWLEVFEGPDYNEASHERDAKRVAEWQRLFQDKCVVLRGKFNAKLKGHFGMWPAGIESIANIAAAQPDTCGPMPFRETPGR